MNLMEYHKLKKHTVYRGDDMDKQVVTIPDAMHELELEILLHINERLFHSGRITTEIREKAKELILKS